jgi:hypothetical protein
MTHPITNLKAFCGDLSLVDIYRQAIAWEELRVVYFTKYNITDKAMQAAARAQHYEAAYDALPERGHITKRAYR